MKSLLARLIILFICVFSLASCNMSDAGAQQDVNLPAVTPGESGSAEPQRQQEMPGGETTGTEQVDDSSPTNTPEPTHDQPAPPTEAPTDSVAQAAPVEIDARGSGEVSLDAAWAQAVEMPPGVPFRITISEAEIEDKILSSMTSSGYGANISSLDVTLQNGQIGLSFIFTVPDRTSAQVQASVVFNASIDANGDLVLTVASAEAGRFSIPPEMLTAFSDALAEAMTGAASSAETEVTLTSLVIADGLMTIEGYAQP